jgi:hypothetical protein
MRRVLRAAHKEGMPVSYVEILPDRTIRVHTAPLPMRIWSFITSRHCTVIERSRRSRWRLDGGSSQLNLAACRAFCKR